MARSLALSGGGGGRVRGRVKRAWVFGGESFPKDVKAR